MSRTVHRLHLFWSNISTCNEVYVVPPISILYYKHGWRCTISPSRAETPTETKSRCLPAQPPGWSTRELHCAALLRPRGTRTLSPAGKPHGEENQEARWVRTEAKCYRGARSCWAAYVSVRGSQHHVLERSMEDEGGLHNNVHVWDRGKILCQNKDSCLGQTVPQILATDEMQGTR